METTSIPERVRCLLVGRAGPAVDEAAALVLALAARVAHRCVACPVAAGGVPPTALHLLLVAAVAAPLELAAADLTRAGAAEALTALDTEEALVQAAEAIPQDHLLLVDLGLAAARVERHFSRGDVLHPHHEVRERS